MAFKSTFLFGIFPFRKVLRGVDTFLFGMNQFGRQNIPGITLFFDVDLLGFPVVDLSPWELPSKLLRHVTTWAFTASCRHISTCVRVVGIFLDAEFPLVTGAPSLLWSHHMILLVLLHELLKLLLEAFEVLHDHWLCYQFDKVWGFGLRPLGVNSCLLVHGLRLLSVLTLYTTHFYLKKKCLELWI